MVLSSEPRPPESKRPECDVKQGLLGEVGGPAKGYTFPLKHAFEKGIFETNATQNFTPELLGNASM